MSGSGISGRVTGWAQSRWFWIVLLWVLLAMLLAAPLVREHAIHYVGDHAMRMSEIRDLVNGQSWFDTTQYRDNTPYGAPMHWSRLIDGPVALIIIALRPLLGIAGAETAALVIWPYLLVGALATLLVHIADWLAGRAAAAFVVLVTALAVTIHSDFGLASLDHHNVQDVLALLAIYTTLRARKDWRWAVLAGITGATSIAIGTEGLPIVVAQLIVVPLFWVFAPDRSARTMLAFGGSFALATLLHLVLVTPPAAYFAVYCDAISFTYVSAAALYALALLGAWAVGRRSGATPVIRLVALAVGGIAAVGLTLLLSPECRAGPYGNLPPWLADILLTPIGEAQPIWIWLTPPRRAIVIALLPLFALIANLVAVVIDRQRRVDWLVLLAFMLTTVLVAVLQVRGIRLATIVGLPVSAWAISIAWHRFRAHQSLGTALRLSLTAALFMGVLHWSIANVLIGPGPGSVDGGPSAFDENLRLCSLGDAYPALAQLPPSHMMSYLIIGPSILLHTPHSIVSAGYHRNVDGLADVVKFFGGTEAEAREVVEQRDLDYLVLCRGIPPEEALAGVKSFTGLEWDWLTPISDPDEVVQIYRIER